MAFSQFVILLSCLIPSSSIIMATIVNFIFDINRLCHLGSQSLFVSALGTKRLASEELANDWDNKRLNPGNDNYPLLVYIYDLLNCFDILPKYFMVLIFLFHLIADSRH